MLTLAALCAPLFVVSSTRGSSPCLPAVHVEGDAALRDEVAQGLRNRGVLTEPLEGCPLTRVRLSRRDLLIAVALSEEARRTQRLATDTDTVISLIESWVRSDLAAPLLFAPPPAELPPPPLLPPLPVAVNPIESSPRGLLELYAEAGSDISGRAFVGGGLRGCGHIGRVCLGGALRTAGNVSGSVESGRQISTEILALLALPTRVGPLMLSPSVGLGVAWVHHAADVAVPVDRSGSSDKGSDDSHSGNAIAVSASADQGRLCAEARLQLGVPLSRGVGLFAAAAFDAALTGHDGPLVGVVDPQSGETLAAQLPPAPWGIFFAQLGLYWRAR